MGFLARRRFLFHSRPLFRTCEIICNHAARILGVSGHHSNALAKLNERRKQCQRVLNRIGQSHDHVCAKCRGKCCGGARERDAFTDRVLQVPDTPHRSARRVSGRMPAYEIMAPNEAERASRCDLQPVAGYCPELTDQGCRLPYELRPMQCTAYFCKATTEELTDLECSIGVKAVIGLMQVQMRTVGLALRSRLSLGKPD
jgi:hypothetical protein